MNIEKQKTDRRRKLLATLGFGLDAVFFEEHAKTLQKLGAWCSGSDWVVACVWVRLLKTVCLGLQLEGVEVLVVVLL
jgi:hypothetical protein